MNKFYNLVFSLLLISYIGYGQDGSYQWPNWENGIRNLGNAEESYLCGKGNVDILLTTVDSLDVNNKFTMVLTSDSLKTPIVLDAITTNINDQNYSEGYNKSIFNFNLPIELLKTGAKYTYELKGSEIDSTLIKEDFVFGQSLQPIEISLVSIINGDDLLAVQDMAVYFKEPESGYHNSLFSNIQNNIYYDFYYDGITEKVNRLNEFGLLNDKVSDVRLRPLGFKFPLVDNSGYINIDKIVNSCGVEQEIINKKVEVSKGIESDTPKFALGQLENLNKCERNGEIQVNVSGEIKEEAKYNLYLYNSGNPILLKEDIREAGKLNYEIPSEVKSGEYYYQIRNVERKDIDIYNEENVRTEESILLDSNPVSQTLENVPNVKLIEELITTVAVSGIGRINVPFENLNSTENYNVEFENGSSFYIQNKYVACPDCYGEANSFLVNYNVIPQTIVFKPKKVFNSCGVGAIEGQTIVRILPKTEHRVYNIDASSVSECLSNQDSLNVRVVFMPADSLLAKAKVELLYVADSLITQELNTTGYKRLTPESTANGQEVTFYFDRPTNIDFSKQYYFGIKNLLSNGGLENISIPSSSKYIRQTPTATLNGTFAQGVGAETKATVSINEENPWLLKVVDQEGGIAFNNFPDISIDSLSKLDINQFSPITTKDYEISLIANQDNVYHIDQAYSETCGLAQTEGQLTVTLVLGQEDLDASINIFPNPSASLITVDLSSLNSPATLSIIDQRGKSLQTIKDITEKSKTIDVSSYTSGTYMLNIRTKEGSKSFRVVKQ